MCGCIFSRRYLHKSMRLDDQKCQAESKILYLDRKTRNASNALELVEALHKMKLTNTIIDRTLFDHLPVMEQLEKVFTSTHPVGTGICEDFLMTTSRRL